MTEETPAPDSTDDVDEAVENTDDGRGGTLDKPREQDEGGERATDTIPDA